MPETFLFRKLNDAVYIMQVLFQQSNSLSAGATIISLDVIYVIKYGEARDK